MEAEHLVRRFCAIARADIVLVRRNGSVKVDWAVSDGTATAGEVYTSGSGTLTFNPGETVKTIRIPLLEDETFDGDETFTLTLSNPAEVELTDSEATGTIMDNDPEPLTARFEHVPETGRASRPSLRTVTPSSCRPMAAASSR